MTRANAWAAFYRVPKGWVLMVNTVRRTKMLARAACLGDLAGSSRERRSAELQAEINFKIAPVQISPLPHQTAADKRRARLAAASRQAG